MRYLGNFILGYNNIERRTIDPAAGFYSNGTLFKGTPAAPVVITNASQIDATTLGVLMIQPDGVDIIAGDKIDIVLAVIASIRRMRGNPKKEQMDCHGLKPSQ